MAIQVVGTWRLKAFDRRTADGNVSFPLGPDAVGYLSYTPDGFVFVSMMRPGRPALATQDALGGTPEEKARAASGFVAYCGRYEVRGDQVVHHIEQSLFPNWVGTSERRFVEVDGNRLTVTTDPSDTRRTSVSRAVWERATPTSAAQVA